VTNLEQRACFPDEDGKLILRIPVCHQQEDFIVCHFASKVHWVSFLRGANSVQGEGSHSVLDNLEQFVAHQVPCQGAPYCMDILLE
jgi:hypothetical protein